MLLLNLALVMSLAASAAFGARIAGERGLRCDDNNPAYLCRGIQDNTKIRRGGTLGLFPFPRVGRSQMEKTWLISPQDYSELHHEMKRQGLIPFPRVGRAMVELGDGRRYGDVNSGMWFGPRLGRFSKKNVFDDVDPWTMAALREISPSRDISPRLGREQEEYMTEDQADQAEHPDESVRQKRSNQ